jgi:hypothetical protein
MFEMFHADAAKRKGTDFHHSQNGARCKRKPPNSCALFPQVHNRFAYEKNARH